MAYIYLNNKDYYKIYERAQKEQKTFSGILKEELHKPPQVKEVVKEVVKEDPRIEQIKKYMDSVRLMSKIDLKEIIEGKYT